MLELESEVVFDLRCGLFGCEYALGGFDRWLPGRSVVARAGGSGIEPAGGMDDDGGVGEKGGEFAGLIVVAEPASMTPRGWLSVSTERSSDLGCLSFQVSSCSAMPHQAASPPRVVGGGPSVVQSSWVGSVAAAATRSGRVWSRAS